MNHSQFKLKPTQSTTLHGQQWLPETEPKAIIAIIHGYDEHSGRYAHVAKYLTTNYYGVVACDLRGHGISSGKRVYISSIHEYLQDVLAMQEWIQENYSAIPMFIYGHSMGGAISVLHCLQYQQDIAGLITTGGAFKPSDDISPLMVKLSGYLSIVTPWLPTIKLDSKALSRDKAVVDAYEADPLVNQKAFYARTGAELVKASHIVQQDAHKLTLPLLIMHGTADRLADPEGSRLVYEKASSKDKALQMYDGWYHELVNEPDKHIVLDEMVQWLDKHCQ